MNAKKAFYSNYFRFSLHTNPFNATHALLGSICCMSPLIYLVFPTVCLGFVNGSCPVQTHSSALSAGAGGGLCSKARQEKGKTVQQREDGVSPSSSPAGLRRAGIQTRNLQIDDFPQPPPQATASPRGCVTRGLLKKCLRPWKKKKC